MKSNKIVISKLIRCSKFFYSNDTKIECIAIWTICSIGIISVLINSSYTNILRYISYIFAISLILWDFFIRGKKTEIEIDENELLKVYKENKENADKKYYDKYIKLRGKVSYIECDEYKNIFITLKSDDKYSIKALLLFANKKCIKYIENIHEGDRIIIYGDFTREDNRLILYGKYLKIS